MDAEELYVAVRDDLAKRVGASRLLAPLPEALSGASSLTAFVQRVLCRYLAAPGTPEAVYRAMFDDVALPDATSLCQDIERYVERDFTADGPLDIVLFSNGFHALTCHRIARALMRDHRRDDARLLMGAVGRVFGIELDAGAQIGRRVFLDHGRGTVVGETAIIGDDCAIFQGVTLGSTARAEGKRHPVLGVGVVVGAGAKIIGPVEIGDGAVIGPNAVVMNDVPPGARVR